MSILGDATSVASDLGLSLNSLISESLARQPNGAVTVNGLYVPWESFEVDSNNYYEADTFRIDIPSGSLPATVTPSYFSSTPAVLIQIFAGFPPFPALFSSLGLDSLIVGQVDDITYDPVKTLITLSGRDLTAKFIDNKTTEKFQNLTSSQIASLLANRRGLTPVVTATTTKVGKYYQIDNARLTDQKSEWDLLNYLAHEENFDVFVQGQSLYFQPKVSETATTPYVIYFNEPFISSGAPVGNFVELELGRNLTLAKDIIVKVRSWNQKQKKGFVKTATATHNKNTVLAGAAQPIGDAQTYSYVYPNLTPQQALQKAQNLLAELSKHEMRASIVLPGNNLIKAQNIIKLTGTGTNWDQNYYADSVVRTMSITEGYNMRIEAKNHSPVSDIFS